jgi:serine/threonine protein phosphatase PrpC
VIGQQENTTDTQRYKVHEGSKQAEIAPAFRIEVAGISDVGQKRSNNEDSFGYDLETNIFVVCDGMGGMAAGEIASSTAVELTLRKYKELSHLEAQPKERLRLAIASANETVWSLAQQDNMLRGMGTTLVAACVFNNMLILGNVGDSRAYLLRDGNCTQITEDHSYAAEQMRRGGSSVGNGIVARLQQFITRAVGVGAAVTPDFFTIEIVPGDTVLLATDGLTRYADAGKLAEYISIKGNLEEMCRGLLTIAYEKGAEDNVTCLLLRMH